MWWLVCTRAADRTVHCAASGLLQLLSGLPAAAHSTQCRVVLAAAWPCTLPPGYSPTALTRLASHSCCASLSSISRPCADAPACLCCLPLLQGELDELEDESASTPTNYDFQWIATREYLAMGSLFATGASSLTQLLLQAGGAFLKHVANGDYRKWHDVGGLVWSIHPVCALHVLPVPLLCGGAAATPPAALASKKAAAQGAATLAAAL